MFSDSVAVSSAPSISVVSIKSPLICNFLVKAICFLTFSKISPNFKSTAYEILYNCGLNSSLDLAFSIAKTSLYCSLILKVILLILILDIGTPLANSLAIPSNTWLAIELVLSNSTDKGISKSLVFKTLL